VRVWWRCVLELRWILTFVKKHNLQTPSCFLGQYLDHFPLHHISNLIALTFSFQEYP